MDFFNECIIKRHKSASDFAKIAGIVIATFAAILLMFIQINSNYYPMFVPIEFAIVLYIEYRLLTGMNIEFEYSVTNNYMDVDKIVARSKRSRITSVDVKDFEYFAPYNGQYENVYNNPSIVKKTDVSCNTPSDSTYFAIYTQSGQKTCLIFNPTEKMVENFSNYIPQSCNFYR